MAASLGTGARPNRMADDHRKRKRANKMGGASQSRGGDHRSSKARAVPRAGPSLRVFNSRLRAWFAVVFAVRLSTSARVCRNLCNQFFGGDVDPGKANSVLVATTQGKSPPSSQAKTGVPYG